MGNAALDCPDYRREGYDLDYHGVKSRIDYFPGVEFSLAISHSVYLSWILRGQGLGKEAHEHRLQFCRWVGIKYLLCSVRRDNVPQHKIMDRFKWKKLDQTDTYCHNIVMYGRDLSDIEIKETKAVV